MAGGVLNQTDIVSWGDPVAGDRARWTLVPGFGGIGVVEADLHHFSFAPHSHDTLMFCAVLDGVLNFRRGRDSHRIPRGRLVVLNPGEINSGAALGDGSRLRYLTCYPSAALMAAAGLPESGDFASCAIADADLWAQAVAALRASDAPLGEAALLALFADLGRRHGPRLRRSGGAAVDRGAVARARDFVEAHLDEPLRLEQVAAAAAVSPRHLARGFAAVLGLTPQAYLRQARIARAAGLLRQGQAPGAVAAATGFADQAHLTRSFRAAMAITPAAYARLFADRSVIG